MHAVFTTLAYHLHEPLPDGSILHDLGFEIFPAIPESQAWISEMFLYMGFGAFGVWLVSPFATRRKSFHSVVVLKRVLVVLVTCQVLRIISFLATQVSMRLARTLPGTPPGTAPWDPP